MKTITDRNGNILQPTDIIIVETNTGNKKARILKINNNKLQVHLLKEKKVMNLDIVKHQDFIELYNIDNYDTRNEHNTFPLIRQMMTETKNSLNDSELNPEFTLEEMVNAGLNVKGLLTESQKKDYAKVQIKNLLKQAKKFTRDFKELKSVGNALDFINNKL